MTVWALASWTTNGAAAKAKAKIAVEPLSDALSVGSDALNDSAEDDFLPTLNSPAHVARYFFGIFSSVGTLCNTFLTLLAEAKRFNPKMDPWSGVIPSRCTAATFLPVWMVR